MVRRPYDGGQRWAIILAGGEGTRLSLLTINRFGEHRPKQYCAFLGERTMFDHTMDRAVGFVGRQRIVTVIGHGHMRFLAKPRPSPLFGYVVEQPCNRETAPGVFLPLAYVLAHDPEATVAIFPSDHYIAPNEAFLASMDRAARVAEKMPDHLVLAAAVADRPEVEYGWIQPGAPIKGYDGLASVRQFHEKPDPSRALSFYNEGFLWNTLNMAVKGATLWDLGRKHQPQMMERFERLRAAIGTARETETLAQIYADMPLVNFSKAILERAVAQALVMPMQDLEWSDWGKPERIQETLDRRAAARGARVPAAPAPALAPSPSLVPAV